MLQLSCSLLWWCTGAKPHSDLHRKAPEGCGPTHREVCRGVAVDGKPHLPADVVAQSQRPPDLHHRWPVPHRRQGDLMIFWCDGIEFPLLASNLLGIRQCLKRPPAVTWCLANESSWHLNSFDRIEVYLCFQVLVAPVVEKGAVQRDIYLPDGGFQWQDSQSAQVFDGGMFLQDYPVPLEDIAVFLQRSWVTRLIHRVTWLILLLFSIKFIKKATCAVLNLHFSSKDHWSCLKALSWDNMSKEFFILALYSSKWFFVFSSFVSIFLPFFKMLIGFTSWLICYRTFWSAFFFFFFSVSCPYLLFV